MIFTDFSSVLSQFTRLTDRQTAETILIARLHLHSMQRQNNNNDNDDNNNDDGSV